jgi:hypothetical protein
MIETRKQTKSKKNKLPSPLFSDRFLYPRRQEEGRDGTTIQIATIVVVVGLEMVFRRLHFDEY